MKTAIAATAENSNERMELTRRAKFLGALLELTSTTADHLVSWARRAAAGRRMAGLESAAESRIPGALAGTSKLTEREYQLVLELLAAKAETVLQAEMDREPVEAVGLRSFFNQAEKKQTEDRARLLTHCVTISGLTVVDLAGRLFRTGELVSIADAQRTIEGISAGKLKVSAGQWNIIRRLFIGAARQGLQTEITLDDSVSPEVTPQADRDARFFNACMLITGAEFSEVARNVKRAGERFNIAGLVEDTEEKLREVIEGRSILMEIERVNIFQIVLPAAVKIVQELLRPGQESSLSAARFADVLTGAIDLQGQTADDAAVNVARLAVRLYAGRLESQAAKLLKQFFAEPSSVTWSAEESQILCNAVLPAPLRMLAAELVVCE